MSNKYVDDIMDYVNEGLYDGEREDSFFRKLVDQQISKAQLDGIRSFIDYSCKVGGYDRVTMEVMFGGYLDYHDIKINKIKAELGEEDENNQS